MTSSPEPLAIARQVVDALDTLGVVSTIGGSIASSVAGEPRRSTSTSLRHSSRNT